MQQWHMMRLHIPIVSSTDADNIMNMIGASARNGLTSVLLSVMGVCVFIDNFWIGFFVCKVKL